MSRSRWRASVAYVVLVVVPVLVLLRVLETGTTAPPAGPVLEAPGAPPTTLSWLIVLLLQITVIVVASRALGALFRRVQQPQVVGEMVAGIVLGPSLFGALAPAAFATVFPPESFGYLAALSQVGLVLFMFLIGLEFNPALLRGRGYVALVTSHASIALPFVLGAILALHLYDPLAPANVRFEGFALFLGAAMSITAFPVLARILGERKLIGTRVGALALACAAVDDATAWCILAIVVIVVRAGATDLPLALTIGGTVVFASVLLFVIRPLLRRWVARRHAPLDPGQNTIAAVLVFALICAIATERLGIHALFGAFLAGVVLPKQEQFVQKLTHRLEDFTVVFLLPLFFAFTGLRTSIGSISGGGLWGYAGLILLVAITGKLVGSAVAARATGLPTREAAAIGVLMNTRGLMELVILNIGLDIGVISPPLFTMMVFMAVITTLMTTPLLNLILPSAAQAPANESRHLRPD